MDKQQAAAMNIVNQLFDLAEVPVEKRQAINDKADQFLSENFHIRYAGEAREAQSPSDAVAVSRPTSITILLNVDTRLIDSVYYSKSTAIDICRENRDLMPMTFSIQDPAPQAAGPVWVKETVRVPDHYRNVHIRYKTLHLGDYVSASTTVRYNVSAKKWLTQQGKDLEGYIDLEWLDESPQQVFTREQVAAAFKAGEARGYLVGQNDIQGHATMSEFERTPDLEDFMNTNFPPKPATGQ